MKATNKRLNTYPIYWNCVAKCREDEHGNWIKNDPMMLVTQKYHLFNRLLVCVIETVDKDNFAYSLN